MGATEPGSFGTVPVFWPLLQAVKPNAQAKAVAITSVAIPLLGTDVLVFASVLKHRIRKPQLLGGSLVCYLKGGVDEISDAEIPIHLTFLLTVVKDHRI